MLDFRRRDCDAARELLSARLDEELSELETALLDAHLGRCADCSAWAKGVDEVTRQLRDAPLELPTEHFAPPRRARRRAEPFAFVAASAAALVSALALGGLQSSVGPGQSAMQRPVGEGVNLISEQGRFGVVASLDSVTLPSAVHGRLRPL